MNQCNRMVKNQNNHGSTRLAELRYLHMIDYDRSKESV